LNNSIVYNVVEIISLYIEIVPTQSVSLRQYSEYVELISDVHDKRRNSFTRMNSRTILGSIFHRLSTADQRTAESTSIGAGCCRPEDTSEPGRRRLASTVACAPLTRSPSILVNCSRSGFVDVVPCTQDVQRAIIAHRDRPAMPSASIIYAEFSSAVISATMSAATEPAATDSSLPGRVSHPHPYLSFASPSRRPIVYL